MLNGQKLVVIMPAYNAELTLEKTYRELPHDIVDDVILVDDFSRDATAALARRLGLITHQHDRNRGYGGNQKTCYAAAMQLGADIVVMVHPDYQYTPKLLRSLASLLSEGVYDVALGSRILGMGALKGGMPKYKYVFNRILTAIENLMIGQKLSEYHTGYRAFRREVLESLRLEGNSDDFVFDNEMLVQCHALGYRIGEVSCPTSYFEEASSISFRRSVRYGFGCLAVAGRYMLHRFNVRRDPQFLPRERPVAVPAAAASMAPRAQSAQALTR
jgi:glycosyltransferase involved in cell wall biosynthesis